MISTLYLTCAGTRYIVLSDSLVQATRCYLGLYTIGENAEKKVNIFSMQQGAKSELTAKMMLRNTALKG